MSKTIREIPNCGAPAGCCSVVIVWQKERSASGEHQGHKNHQFSLQMAQKAASLYSQWESEGTSFCLQTTTILACFFTSFWCIK